MKLSFKIGSIWGIPIELHLTFLLLIIAVFFLFYPEIYSFILILFLFLFVVFHELAHSIVARKYGIKVRKIILYPIGGVSEIEEVPDNPKIEWRMAFAGPVTSLILGGVLLLVNQFVLIQIPLSVVPSTIPTSGNLLLDLGILNISLGAFNLIPAFPMDGGRVFRALLAERLKYSDATKYAVYLGRIFAIGMIVAGFFLPGYFLLIVVGIFVYIGASEEAEQTIISTTLANVRVRDVMQSFVAAVTPEQTIAEALEVMFKNRYHDAVVEKDGALLGVVTWGEIIKVAPKERSSIKVGEMPLKNISTYPDEAVLEVYKLMTAQKMDVIPIVEREATSKVVGVLTSESIARAYEKAKNSR